MSRVSTIPKKSVRRDIALPAQASRCERLGVLDGWRGISILLVLGGHMLPLGTRRFSLNYSAGLAGMALFFTLSGFLITTTLSRNPSVASFLVRRFFRIVPLSAVVAIVFLTILRENSAHYLYHLLYVTNYKIDELTVLTSPYWSLCVEIHFYLLTAFLFFVLRNRALLVLPLIGLGITWLRIREGVYAGLETHLRADEIFAGSTLALIWTNQMGRAGRSLCAALRFVPLPLWFVVFATSCLEFAGPLQYFRPYLAAAVVGCSLLNDGWRPAILSSRTLRYVAEISFALYLVHKVTMYGWLGTGGTLVRYSKRVLSFLLSFGLAHVATFGFERHMTAFGKKLSRRLDRI